MRGREPTSDEGARLLASERAAREECERTSRLKDEIVATLGHDLRTPLNSILGWTQLLRRGKLSPEDAAQATERIERSARAQARILGDGIDAIRILSGRLRLEVRPVEVARVVGRAVEAVLPEAEAKGIAIEKALDPPPPTVEADPERIERVLRSLLTNAIRSSARGARVRVAARGRDSSVELEVEDFGQGIDPAVLPGLFERSHEHGGAEKADGLGSGLWVARRLVELHGGTLVAESDGVGKGARFRARIPLAPPRPTEPRPAPGTA